MMPYDREGFKSRFIDDEPEKGKPMETFNIKYVLDGDAWLRWAIIELYSTIDNPPKFPVDEKGDSVVNIECSINGNEVVFSSLLDKLKKQFESDVKERAMELFSNKYGTHMKMLHEASDLFLEKVGVKRNELESWYEPSCQRFED
jgi:hypothetical protein